MSYDCWCIVPLPIGVVGCSTVYGCGNSLLCNIYTIGCLPIRGDNPKARGLSYVHVDKHDVTIVYQLYKSMSTGNLV